MVAAPPARGKQRPLLEGVFRKACNYCVRSKRGCNGGTPCEQCIRRKQECTYSQRRKSGPRGRPVRQPAPSPVSNLTACNANASMTSSKTKTKRKSGRRRLNKHKDEGTPRPRVVPDAVEASRTDSPAPSEASTLSAVRTASFTSLSSSSDASISQTSSRESAEEAGWDSDTDYFQNVDDPLTVETTSSEMEPETAGPQQQRLVEKIVETNQMVSPSMQSSNPPSIAEMLLEPISPTAERPLSVSVMAKVGKMQLRSPVTTALPAPPDSAARPIEQQQQQQQQSSMMDSNVTITESSRLWAQTMLTSGAQAPQNGDRFVEPMPHAISSQPREISSGSASQRAHVPGMLDKMLVEEVGPAGDMNLAFPMYQLRSVNVAAGHVSAPAPATFGGALVTQPTFTEELSHFAAEPELEDCPSFRMMVPSLTREMSLARAVEALGGEQLHGGIGEVSAYL